MSVMGVDLGSDHCGICVLNTQMLSASRGIAYSIVSNPTLYATVMAGRFPSAKIRSMTEQIIAAINRYQVSVVILEQPFVNSHFPHVAIRLYRLYHYLLDQIGLHCPTVERHAVTAPKARKLLGYNRKLGTSTKDAVKIMLQNHSDIINTFPTMDSLDEHALDAIVCVYAYLRSIGETHVH